MSYLIQNEKIVARTSEALKSGETIRYSHSSSGSSLVNAEYAKVSNAKKWKKIEDNEFFGNTPIAVIFDNSGVYREFIVLN